MKKLQLVKKPKTIFGKPFKIMDYDEPADKDGEPKFIEEATMIDLLTLMVYGIPRDKLTMKDSIEAGRFISQIRESKNGVLALEDEEHKWIKKTVDDHGTSVFGVNAAIIGDFLETFERLHEKKEKEVEGEKKTD